jgi:hypothetical protein
MIVLALWALATVHCDLEMVPGLAFLASCHQQETAPEPENHCDGDACTVVESGFYRMEEAPVSLPAPELVFSLLPPLPEVSCCAAGGALASPTDAPLELQTAWQFVFRTALPPRAPSAIA